MEIKIFKEKMINSVGNNLHKMEISVNGFIKDKDVQSIKQSAVGEYLIITVFYKI